MPLEQRKSFRQQGSTTPGHPENFETVGVETTTWPLGQGVSNAVGMALAARHLVARFPEAKDVLEHYTYVTASDGDLQEGPRVLAVVCSGHQVGQSAQSLVQGGGTGGERAGGASR